MTVLVAQSKSDKNMASWKKRTRSATNPDLDRSPQQKRRRAESQFLQGKEEIAVPLAQTALLLHAIRQPYSTEDHEVPVILNESEILIKVEVVGLNPIDWKAP
jgi:hypothetical protein